MKKLLSVMAAGLLVLSASGLVVANGPKVPAEPPKPEDGKVAEGKDGEKPAPALEKKKLERPGLDASKVPGVPPAGGGLMCVNPGTLAAVGRFMHAMKADDLAAKDVAAVPFLLDGKKSVATLAELDGVFAKIRKDKVRPGGQSWVIADVRVVPKGATLEEAEAWLGLPLSAKQLRGGEAAAIPTLWDLAVKESADLVAVFLVGQRAGRTAEDPPRKSGEMMLIAVKDPSSAVSARVIGFVD